MKILRGGVPKMKGGSEKTRRVGGSENMYTSKPTGDVGGLLKN